MMTHQKGQIINNIKLLLSCCSCKKLWAGRRLYNISCRHRIPCACYVLVVALSLFSLLCLCMFSLYYVMYLLVGFCLVRLWVRGPWSVSACAQRFFVTHLICHMLSCMFANESNEAWTSSKNEGTSSQLMHGPIQGPLSLMNSEGFDIKVVVELFGLEEVRGCHLLV